MQAREDDGYRASLHFAGASHTDDDGGGGGDGDVFCWDPSDMIAAAAVAAVVVTAAARTGSVARLEMQLLPAGLCCVRQTWDTLALSGSRSRFVDMQVSLLDVRS